MQFRILNGECKNRLARGVQCSYLELVAYVYRQVPISQGKVIAGLWRRYISNRCALNWRYFGTKEFAHTAPSLYR